MAEILVGLLLVVSAALGLVLGSRRGMARVGWTLLRAFAPLGAGIWVAASALRAGCYAPAGLFTPVLLGLAAVPLSAWSLRRLRRGGDVPAARPGAASRIAGGLAGCALGCVVAAGVLVSAAVAGALAATRLEMDDGTTAFDPPRTVPGLRLVRDVPGLGGLAEELESLAYVLRTSPEIRERFVEQNGWDRLRDTPSFRAIRADRTLRRDIASAARGDLGALFRLQRSPKVIRFFEEPEIRGLVRDLRPSDLARRLRAAEASLIAPKHPIP